MDTLPIHAVDLWLQQASRYGLRLLVALLLILAGMQLARWAARAVGSALLARHIDRLLAEFVRSTIVAVGVVVVVLAALQLTGIPTASFLAVLGTAGLAIGLALKDSLSQLAAGVQLMVLRPFRAGDQVTVAGQEGRVQSVRLFQTILLSPDNRHITLPNAAIVTQPIVNASRCERRRIDLAILLSIDTPLAAAIAALQPVLARAGFLADPAPRIAAADISDKGILLQVQVWTPSEAFAEARARLVAEVQAAFAAAGIRPIGPPAPALPAP